MASTVAYVANSKGQDTGTPFQSGSISTWGDGNVGLVAVQCFNSGSGTEPSGLALTGNGQTWVSLGGIGHTDGVSGAWRLEVFIAHLSSPSTGVLAVTGSDFTAATFFGAQVTEVPSSSADVQTVTAEGNSTAPGLTLAAFGDAANVTVFFVGTYIDGTSPTTAFDGSLVEPEAEQNAGGETLGMGYLIGADLTPSATLSAGTYWSAIGIEIENDGGGASAALIFTNNMMLGS